MAHPNSLKNLKPWAKGQSGNIHRINYRVPPELAGIKALKHPEIVRIISKYARMTRAELQIAFDNPELSTIHAAIISIFKSSIEKADFMKLSFLLDRAVGKVKEIEDDDEEMEDKDLLAKLSMNELLTLVKNNLPSSEDPITPE